MINSFQFIFMFSNSVENGFVCFFPVCIYMDTIIKPYFDNCQYKKMILPNELEVILIYDKDTTISAASMMINVGYLFDKINPSQKNIDSGANGIAHFLEHMLFMGSKKYPGENQYNDFINTHGGSSNAYTASDRTCYYFNIISENFEQGLDIFGNFFVDPLLNPDSISREINAVDSEFKKNINSDNWKLLDVLKIICKKDHPYSNFSTGSTETLNVPNIHQKLIEFYNTYYSSNNMKLVVLHNKSFDVIEKLVHNIFNQVRFGTKNKIIDDFPLISQKEIECNLTTEQHQIFIIYNLPNPLIFYKYLPYNYISYIINHKGKHSLYDLLDSLKLIDDIALINIDEYYKKSIVAIVVKLTDYGFKYRNVISACIFAYIDFLLENGINEKFYSEILLINKLDFEYSPKLDSLKTVLSLSERFISNVPFHDLLALNSSANQYSENSHNLIALYLQCMKKKYATLVYSSPTFHTTRTTKWHKTQYNIVPFYVPKIEITFTKLPEYNIYLTKNLFKQITNGYPEKKDENIYNLGYIYFKKKIMQMLILTWE